MKKALLGGFAIAVIALSAVILNRHLQPNAEPWYHTSDVALLATTGRPQLVEFFHPD